MAKLDTQYQMDELDQFTVSFLRHFSSRWRIEDDIAAYTHVVLQVIDEKSGEFAQKTCR